MLLHQCLLCESRTIAVVKILYFNSGSGSPSETFIADMIAGLRHAGIDLELGLNQSPKPSQALNFEQRPVHDRLLARMACASAERWEYVDRYRCSAAAKRRVERFLLISRPDVAFVDYASQAMLLAPILQKAGIPLVVHVHGFDITATMRNRFFIEQLPELFEATHTWVAPSLHLCRRLILAGCDPASVQLVHYEPNLEGRQPLPLAERSAEPSIVALGRLTPKKNPLALLHAFALVHASLPAARLTIIGSGHLAGKVRQLVGELKLESAVEVAPAMSHQDALARVRQHWLFAQHSVTAPNGDQEGFPVAILEASALALPVVSTRHSGIPEQVIDGETGFLVAEHDYEAMAAKMLELLQDREKCEAMGLHAQQHIQKICPPGQRVKTVIDHLQQTSRRASP